MGFAWVLQLMNSAIACAYCLLFPAPRSGMLTVELTQQFIQPRVSMRHWQRLLEKTFGGDGEELGFVFGAVSIE